ncbi:GntR family transcriptional regulator [Sphingomonas naphthae]|uniref:GntR family transcriptional regulator n=1 Tax=Sphingomonas naphthae TaxID=1813468 RepID=A0ABY7TJJ3_9SPHN|nr:GntR family transcriptional regulator [Sphingomonas naphthae]WCT73088.1 GntR family transcriptional regulator [Sphingomonas naphthae]
MKRVETSETGAILPITPAVEADGQRSSLAQGTYEKLRQSIFDFTLPPGQRYAEQELADMFGVSRTPLRLALHVLAHDGLLEHVGGHSGWQIRPLDGDYYEELYDFRIDLEALAVRRICASGEKPDLSDLLAFWTAPKGQRQVEGPAVAEADEHFHRSLIRLAQSPEMLRTYDRLTDRIRVIRRLDFVRSDRIAATYAEHSAILRAIEAGQAARAERLIRGHIGQSRIEIRKITLHQISRARAAGQTLPTIGAKA